MTTQLNTLRLLLIEDYQLVRLMLRSVLSSVSRYQVVGDFDSIETMLHSKAGSTVVLKPDLILMDLDLGSACSGGKAVAKIHECFPEAKVIALTEHQEAQWVLEAIQAGISGYCPKSAPHQTLFRMIEAVSNGAVWFEAPAAKWIFRCIQMGNDLGMKPAMPNDETIPKQSKTTLLTVREQEVLTLLAQGKSNPQIAAELRFSEHTAKAHVSHILKKLGVCDRVQAAVKAVEWGLCQGA
ncbi:MAG: response regulator transcription factor [Cyanobacteria bacterium]|nr:response regulator transcription factor [Cyanobacteriota bacterium]